MRAAGTSTLVPSANGVGTLQNPVSFEAILKTTLYALVQQQSNLFLGSPVVGKRPLGIFNLGLSQGLTLGGTKTVDGGGRVANRTTLG